MTAVTIRYQILRALQCAGQPLASTEIASLTGVPLLRVKAHLTELHRREKVYRVAGFRWACAGSSAPTYVPIRTRVLGALAAAGRPVRRTWIAQHAGCPVDRVHTCLSELRARGEAVRVHPSRWALAGVAVEPDGVDRRRPSRKVAALLRSSGAAWSLAEVVEQTGVNESSARQILRGMVGRDAAVCIVDRATGARTWQAVQP